MEFRCNADICSAIYNPANAKFMNRLRGILEIPVSEVYQLVRFRHRSISRLYIIGTVVLAKSKHLISTIRYDA